MAEPTHEDSTAPAVSVVIPTRDRPDMLREALDSVRAQTFANYEIIVVVNGPDNPQTPKTLEVANAAGCAIVRIKQAGIGPALNNGVKTARGQWIAFLDDDDVWVPGKLERQFAVANAAAADVVFCDFYLVDEKGSVPNPPLRPPPSQSVSEAMTIRDYGRGCSQALVKRSAILAVGGFDESVVAPDWDLWVRLSWRYRVAWADAYLTSVRHHPENTSKQISWAYVTIWTLRKSLRTLPPELRHLRLRILRQIVKVSMKATEAYIRHNYLRPLRRRFRRAA
jgi:glycosyltransferase involved in cell wall biosynthesis